MNGGSVPKIAALTKRICQHSEDKNKDTQTFPMISECSSTVLTCATVYRDYHVQ